MCNHHSAHGTCFCYFSFLSIGVYWEVRVLVTTRAECGQLVGRLTCNNFRYSLERWILTNMTPWWGTIDSRCRCSTGTPGCSHAAGEGAATWSRCLIQLWEADDIFNKSLFRSCWPYTIVLASHGQPLCFVKAQSSLKWWPFLNVPIKHNICTVIIPWMVNGFKCFLLNHHFHLWFWNHILFLHFKTRRVA